MQVHEFLELSARQYPDRRAAWYKDEWKTFAELDAMANQVGNHLAGCGIRRSTETPCNGKSEEKDETEQEIRFSHTSFHRRCRKISL